ncbi:selenoprotein SelR domain containing protein [Nitzschia inconspicua]|uniref:Selenoprotein SelR domain containing protein n=1 Tax=Nitzschia inconspicua TaxID=303405 RepID=A0A9K3LU31_9STRA|nr:selenoprotein SelR domain containing protein [Nitzschia inconspicua]
MIDCPLKIMSNEERLSLEDGGSSSSGEDFADDTEGNYPETVLLTPPSSSCKHKVSLGNNAMKEGQSDGGIEPDASSGASKKLQSRSKKKQALSFSMHSPRTPRRTAAVPRSLSLTSARRRMHEVDGRPLQHWDRKNFETKRDETCRVVYEPKGGKEFFRKHLPLEDYQVMRTFSLEQPYYSKYNRFFPKRGHFCCKACGNPLYSHVTKFDAEDGWPAFGACVEGAIGVIPSEKRKAQIERENQACIKIQAFVRGVLCRMRVAKMLEELIQQLLDRQKQTKQQSASDEGVESGESSEFKRKSLLFSPNTIKKKLSASKSLKYTLLRALGDDYTEIHCHRCKSHLGDVLEEETVGRDGREFRERHRVNGRALKYVEDDLPKRIMVESSLLFADPARRRLLGLPSPKKKMEANTTLRSVPFVSPRTQRRRLLSANAIAADPLSVSCHPMLQGSSASRRKRVGFDSLSVTSHEPVETGETTNNMLSSSFHTSSVLDKNDGTSTRPIGRRGGRFRATNMQEKRAVLEEFILSKSMH